jgi:DNA-directed RNA polymerase subunit RPC12/RpoP
MEVTTCPHCGSKQIQQETLKDIVLNEAAVDYICKECGYQGAPIVLEKYEGAFQGIKPAIPGFIGPWEIQTRLDNGEKKILPVLWEDARDCIQSLRLKKGDRITVTVDEKIWCVDKVNSP